MQKIQSLSIFFPTYNEELNIAETIHRSIKAVSKITSLYEVIIINDCSTDNTVKIVENLQKEYGNKKLRLISHDNNKGYGGALITGFKNSKYEYVFFSDADLQFDFEEINLLTKHLNEYDVVIGYRHDRQDPLRRIIFAKAWNVLNRILFGLCVKDIDCAFKIIKRNIMDSISITSQGNMISAELLINISQNNIRIKEVPVTHLPRTLGEAKGVSVVIVIKAFKEIYKLFISDLGKKPRKQFLLFATIGIFNTIVDIGLYVILTRLSSFFAAYYVGTKILTYLIGTLSSLALNKFYTFKINKFYFSEVFRFYSVMISTSLINAGLTFIFTSYFGLYDIASVIIATGFSFVFNFIFMKIWVFSSKNKNNVI